MCPEVEKRLKVRKYRSINVVKNKIEPVRNELEIPSQERRKRRRITRRDFLKGTSIIPLIAFFNPFNLLNPVPAHGIFSMDIFSWGCVKCKLGFCMCKVKGLGGVKLIPSIYNQYWYPVGFMEVNRACQFMTSLLPVGGDLLGNIFGTICDILPTGWIQGSDMSQNTGIGRMSQQYMRVHARWYGMTPEIEAFVTTYLETVELCPCSVVDMIKKTVLGPVYDKLQEFEEKIQEFEKKFQGAKKLKDMIDKVKEALDKFTEFPLPVWFTEILSPFWLIEALSPDNLLGGNWKSAIVIAMAQSGIVGHAGACQYALKALKKLGLDISFGGLIDPSFFCVGYWGYGYPRIGVVRNDDPLIAHLLAVARFHHLFSKTLPVIPFKYDENNIRYQLVRPFSTECMKPGCGGGTIPDICEIVDVATNPTALMNMLKDKATSIAGRTMNALDRKTFLVVWKRKKKCCC